MPNEQYNKLLAEQKKAREELLKEITINEYLKNKTSIQGVFRFSELFGRVGHIEFKNEFRGERATLQEITELLNKFKAVKMYKCEDGCLSFRPTIDETAKTTEINPYIITYDGFDGDVFIKWNTLILKEIVEIEVNINKEVANNILKVDYQREDFKGGYRIINVSCHRFGDFDDESFKIVTWARGSDNYPNSFTLYTEDLKKNFKKCLGI
jgi:hypothetical protein